MRRPVKRQWHAKRARHARHTQRARRASILVCVIVVMIVCGAMSLQSSRTLGLALRNVESRIEHDQLQELLALGRLRLKQQLAAHNDYAGERFEVSLEMVPADRPRQGSIDRAGKIVIEPLPPRSETEPQQWRVVASYVHPTRSSIAAIWESR